jgi:hypothetical protein
MTFLETLQAHKGGLIRLKTELYWYGGRIGWDGNPGRVCLILDAATADACTTGATVATAAPAAAGVGSTAAALLLIDGSPHWAWVAEEDVALL